MVYYLALEISHKKFVFEGQEYEYSIYDCKSKDITFSQNDRNPSLLREYEWIIPAALTIGFAHMHELSENELQSHFEIPPNNLKEIVNKTLQDSKLDAQITIVSAEKYKIGKEYYLYVGLKRSDMPNGILYAPLLQSNKGKWIKPSRSRDPDGNMLDLMNKLSKKINELPKNLKNLRSL